MKTPVYKLDPAIRTALVVVAHPDDIDFGTSGTISWLTSKGVDVHYCLVTSGDAGGDDSTHTKEERGAIREAEQTAAAHEVGVTDLTFLRYSDGTVEPTLQLRKDISRVIRRVRPDLVITQNPDRNWDRVAASHPDHRAVGEATLNAVYPDARNPHAFPELLEEGCAPHKVPTVWISVAPFSMVIDITKHFDRKMAALRCHVSQVGHIEDLEKRIRDWGKLNAKNAGMKKGHLAEGFREMNTQ
jgi:LmbE family N-acetylglucosaminyl deacetylase